MDRAASKDAPAVSDRTTADLSSIPSTPTQTESAPASLRADRPSKPAVDHYMIQLDGLRCLAVLAVIWGHLMPERLQLGVAWGSVGVYTFFVLSGFLITGILLRARDRADALGQPMRRTWWNFYVRRFLRIFPAYYLCVAVVAFALPESQHWLAANLLYLSNVAQWRVQSWAGPTTPFWSLAVEEQFYLVWPMVILFLPRRSILPVTIFCIASAPIFRVTYALLAPHAGYYRLLPNACLDALCLGAFLALRRAGGFDTRRFEWICLAIGLLAFVPIRYVITHHIGTEAIKTLEFTAIALIATWLIGRASIGFTGLVGRTLSLAPVVYLGTIAYGLYLWHVPVMDALAPAFRGSGFFNRLWPHNAWVIAINCAVTLAIAMLSFHLYERPIVRLKRWWPYVTRSRTDARDVAQRVHDVRPTTDANA